MGRLKQLQMFKKSRKARQAEDTNPNLIPVMNLFVAMIPFLLMSAVFVHLRIINASVPTISEDNTIEVQKRKVTATLRIKQKELSLAAGNEWISAEEEKQLRYLLPNKKRNKHDFKGLTAALVSIKKKYNKSDTIVIIPDMKIPYAVLIKAMDASRKMPGVEETCTEAKCYLFPNVVVSSLVQ